MRTFSRMFRLAQVPSFFCIENCKDWGAGVPAPHPTVREGEGDPKGRCGGWSQEKSPQNGGWARTSTCTLTMGSGCRLANIYPGDTCGR